MKSWDFTPNHKIFYIYDILLSTLVFYPNLEILFQTLRFYSKPLDFTLYTLILLQNPEMFYTTPLILLRTLKFYSKPCSIVFRVSLSKSLFIRFFDLDIGTGSLVPETDIWTLPLKRLFIYLKIRVISQFLEFNIITQRSKDHVTRIITMSSTRSKRLKYQNVCQQRYWD